MKIIWDKVTWYSKALAMVFFIILPFVGFYLGMKYGAFEQYGTDLMTRNKGEVSASAADLYYESVPEWQTDQRSDAGFSIAYPIDFPVDDNHSVTPVDDWSLNAFGTQGVKVLELDIPKVFEPQTNFADAKLTIGRSADRIAVNECLSPSTEGQTSFSTTTINGIDFSKLVTSDAGAGNLYETTSYRTLHNGQCYAVEYTIHSSQIGNYPPEYGLQSLDETKLHDVLDRIVGTFKFL